MIRIKIPINAGVGCDGCDITDIFWEEIEVTEEELKKYPTGSYELLEAKNA